MNEIYADIQQGTPEWFALRLGSIGGTGITTAVSNGSGRKKYMYALASEIITGVKVEDFKFKHADRGHIYEPPARELFEFRYGVKVQQVALIKDGPHMHHSPDGLFGDDDMIEIKVRLPHVFLEIIEDNPAMSTSDRRQVQWGFAKWKRKRCHYIQYCPEYENAGLDPMIVKTITPDWDEIRTLERGAKEFIEEMTELIERQRGRNG